ncbi:MAG: cmx8 [Gemmataceae bacterium]|nr:cmx8 [Gemmataceae bacterium]
MGKTRTPKPPKPPKPTDASKPTNSSEVVVNYDLFDLPTAFHKAGLAGLILLIESLKARQELTADVAKYEVTPTEATVTFTEPLVRKLMDDLYDARKVEKRYAQPKKKDNKPISPKRVDVEKREEGGKVKEVKWHIYDEVEPCGQFLRDQYPEMPDDRSWLKLWRDMLWNIPRGRPKQREPFDQRAAGQPCKEGPNVWTELGKVRKARAKNGFHTTGVSSSLFPNAQDTNAESIPFEGRAEQNVLLHFWPLTVLLFVPQAVAKDGETDFAGYTLAVPDVTNLSEFVREYPILLASLSKDARGYRPAQAVIDVPAEGALAFLDDLAMLTGLQVETGELRFCIGGVEYLHLHKPPKQNNVKLMAAGRVSPNRRLLAGYRAIACPKDEATRYRNPLFRRGLLVALLDDKLEDKLWHRPFGRILCEFEAGVFIRQLRKADDEKGPPQFATDAAKKFRHETKLFTKTLERHNDMPDTPRPTAPPPVIVNRVVRSYLLSRTQEKTGIDPDKYKTPDGETDYKAIPGEFNDAKQKLAQSLILEFRSRRDQAFVDHFAATFFSVTQRLNEADRLELANLLTVADRRDDLKTITLLSLSANS